MRGRPEARRSASRQWLDTAVLAGEHDRMDWLERLGADLARRHDAVAVLLYGSHARGNARPESDVDVMILVPDDGAPRPSRDARRIPGPDGELLDLDGWLHACDPADPAASFDARKEPGLLRLRGARVLHDPQGCVPRILATLDRVHAEGPTPMPDDERAALHVWGERMLCRILEPPPGREVAAAWRRAELVTVLLPEAYRLRGWWYPGPEPALAELEQRAPALARALAAALRPDARAPELRSLVTLALEA